MVYLPVVCGLLVGWLLFRLTRTLSQSRERSTGGPTRKFSVAFLHPDLGIGGAERLVVDTALGLQGAGCTVVLYTAYHDPSHCFAETRDGTLKVVVAGAWLPRNIGGKGHVLFATLKMLWLAVYCLYASGFSADVFYIDQVSAPLLLVKLLSSVPTFFYCHFPDKLCDATLAQGTKRSLVRRAYRFVFDTVEEACLACATRVVFNSKFTQATTLATFPSIRRLTATCPKELSSVVYPPINCAALAKRPDGEKTANLVGVEGKTIVLSINRFEGKKNVRMALDAFLKVVAARPEDDSLVLVLAGGYDPRIQDNVAVMKELKAAAAGPHEDRVVFMPSITELEKYVLLNTAQVLMYTPSGEHFGIVPLEAMYSGVPVIACNSAGPLETVLHNKTGMLQDATADSFADALGTLLADKSLRDEMAKAGPTHVVANFSQESYTQATLAHFESIVPLEKGGGGSWLPPFAVKAKAKED